MHACVSCEQRERTESKRKANELLASETVSAQDLRALLDADGTLDASPMLGGKMVGYQRVLDTAECVKAVTRHAAAALQSCGITCLDLRGNKHLDTLPARELCGIEGLTAVECDGCSSLTTIPQSVAEGGGKRRWRRCMNPVLSITHRSLQMWPGPWSRGITWLRMPCSRL